MRAVDYLAPRERGSLQKWRDERLVVFGDACALQHVLFDLGHRHRGFVRQQDELGVESLLRLDLVPLLHALLVVDLHHVSKHFPLAHLAVDHRHGVVSLLIVDLFPFVLHDHLRLKDEPDPFLKRQLLEHLRRVAVSHGAVTLIVAEAQLSRASGPTTNAAWRVHRVVSRTVYAILGLKVPLEVERLLLASLKTVAPFELGVDFGLLNHSGYGRLRSHHGEGVLGLLPIDHASPLILLLFHVHLHLHFDRQLPLSLLEAVYESEEVLKWT